jgi:hypothetical protein
MASQSSAVAVKVPRPSSATIKRFPLLDKYFYFGMSLLIAVVVVYGFSHTINQDLIHATPPAPWVLWLHGAVFSGWVVFFIFQSTLVRTHNVKVHRRTGWFGVGLGSVMTVLGIWTAVVMDRFNFFHFHDPGAKTFFAIQLWDMISFTTFFWLAVLWRRRPEFHRRLILIATCVLTSAAFGRFPLVTFSTYWFYAGVDSLICLGVIRDLIVTKQVHVVYRYALPLLIVGQIVAVHLMADRPEWWVKIANAMMG